MNELDIKLNQAFPGKVVRKDLLHEIKRAVNVPSFVLEFLLSRYCASEDPDEIEEGKKAVLQTIEKNYVGLMSPTRLRQLSNSGRDISSLIRFTLSM